MLHIHSAALHTQLGAVLSALIVVLSIAGLTIHKDFYAGKVRRDFFFFYTNLSNLIVLIYFALAAPRLYASRALHTLIPHAEFAVMMCIILTSFVFHFVLLPAVYRRVMQMPRTREFWIVLTDNLIIHYMVPLLVFVYWLLCSPEKSKLSPADCFAWTLIPLGYVLAVWVRAPLRGVIEEAGSPYPYPFLDIGLLGWRRTAGVCAALYALCIIAGILIIGLTRLLFFLFGSGHTLVLI